MNLFDTPKAKQMKSLSNSTRLVLPPPNPALVKAPAFVPTQEQIALLLKLS